MRRTQVQLDEVTYQFVRAKAFERGMSISALVREALLKHLAGDLQTRMPLSSLIGIGRGGAFPYGAVSEHHDEVFADSILEK